MDLDKLIGMLVAGSFAVRTLDSRRNVPARIAYGLVAYDFLKGAMGGEDVLKFADANEPKLVGSGRSPKLHFNEVRVRSIAQRVSLVHEQMLKGTRDPKVYSLARSVLNRKCGDTWCVPERDAKGELTALFNEVRSRVRYTWDPVDYDAFQTPGKTLELGTGDCDDGVSLLGAMARTIGYRVQSRVVHTKGFPTWNHIYLRAQLPSGEWMALDTTVNKPAGWEVPQELMVQQPKDFDVKEK